MASRRRTDPEVPTSRRRPATTPEGRENQLVAMAIELAEKRMQEGTASAQEIVHFLKLGSTRERLEQERLARENELLRVKAENLASMQDARELFEEAMNAMRRYSGQEPTRQHDDYED